MNNGKKIIKVNQLENSKEIMSFFSIRGFLNDYQFMGVTAVFYGFIEVSKWLFSSLFSYIVSLLMFYFVIIAMQKRCRDFNNKGTFFILIATVAMLSACSIYFIEIEKFYWGNYIKDCAIIMYISLSVLFFIPSKKKKDENLFSPLLKYPFLYTVICWILAIVSTWAVNSYAGVELNLF